MRRSRRFPCSITGLLTRFSVGSRPKRETSEASLIGRCYLKPVADWLTFQNALCSLIPIYLFDGKSFFRNKYFFVNFKGDSS